MPVHSKTDFTMKKILLLQLMLALAVSAFAQHGKPAPKFNSHTAPVNPQLSWPGKNSVPPADNPLQAKSMMAHPLPPLVQRAPVAPGLTVTLGENGLPIMIEGKTAASGSAAENKPLAERAVEYLGSLHQQGIANPDAEFKVRVVQTDEQGNHHVRMDQMFQGLPVWGGEVIAHTRNGAFGLLNGRYYPTPKIATTTPALNADQAIQIVKNAIGISKIKTSWTTEELGWIDGPPFSAELLIFHKNESLTNEHLAWHVIAHPGLMSRLVYFVDAETGEILDSYDNTCNLTGHHHESSGEKTASLSPAIAPLSAAGALNGPVTVSGQDLLNVNRTFTNGGYQVGSTVYLEDASKSMFNAGASSLPDNPVGAIVTLDALNTSPANNNFNYDFISSGNTTFSNKKAAISAHYNAGTSFDYYKTKFNRNSIDGVGGNIVSFVNVTEDDGTSMENAFWNGEAMWYGNGGSVFKPLARGLDVGGHEMTHGVIEKTANLTYQGESGALNESFADVFGSLIEGNNWTIGEDVMLPGVSPSGSLRDLSNPHNGAAAGSPWWQPGHVNEQVTGSQDNGGVHVNSGIPNHAYYLFASDAAVGKTKAEQVYFKALRDYLTKSSKFVDCRLAVIQAATDLYGASVANVAANAFAAVGIGGSAPSGNYQGQLNTNPGSDFVLCVSNDLADLDLATGAGTVLGTLYSQGVACRPSVTDNGSDVIFVDNAGNIIGVSFDYNSNPIQFTTQTLSDQPEWRSCAISKDGRFVAALSSTQEPVIYIFDLFTGDFRAFNLYNPTYSQGQVTGDVQYADVLEFDYSGTNLMYDSYNSLSNNQGGDISYWDIGFLEFWDGNSFTDPNNAFISKLFSGLPENVSIGNPTFSKNSPFIIAFDLIDQSSGSTRYDIYGANVETGDYDVIYSDNGNLGWPNYNRLDNKLMYEQNAGGNSYNLRLQGLATSKIQPSGSNTTFISNHNWGQWYGNGNRSLQVGTQEAVSNLDVSISPNPVQDVATLQLNLPAATDARVEVSNLFGQTALERQYRLVQGDNLINLDLNALPSGSYVVSVLTDTGKAAIKIVKE